MKQLAKLFRSQRHESATKPTPRPTSRRLATESLEKRELLASDLMAGHNYVIPEDVNRDFRVTPLDALQIINQISRNGGKGVDLTSVKRGEMDRFYDVSGDNRITALDALRVINRISKGEAVGELIEYRIQPRTATDTAFSATDFNPATRNLNVAVNQVFNLEVNYVDLRNRFGGDFGAFAVYTNILTSLPDALEPVLTETQTVSVSGRLADISGGSLRFNFAGTPGTTTTRTFSEFFGENGGPINNLGAVLNSLGFQSSQFRISEIILPNDPNSNTIDRSYQIRFTDPALANQNLADLVVTPIGLVDSVGAPVPITTSNDSIAPRNADNSINQAAVPLNINYDSRTYLGGQQFFATGNDSSGSFNSASGFFAVGAIGRIAESVPAASNGLPLIEPFDAFSIPVRVIRPVSNLQIRIGLPIDDNGNYIDPTFATLLYESTDAIPPDKVLINLTNDPEVATDGFGLINVTATGPVGSVTVVANNTTLAATEDTNAIVNVGPLTTVTGSAAAPVFTITTQPARGTVTITGTTATFVPAANDFTVAGAPLTFVYTATVGTTSDTGTITVNIAAVNDPPIFTNDAARSTPRNTVLTIPIAALLANDLPGPANETGTVTLAATPAPTATNGTVTVTGGNFVFTPTNNFTGAAVISYTISDGALTAVATLTVNITAPGVVVVVANNTTLAATEDTNATVNLTPLTTVTGSAAAPVFTITTQSARGTVTISGTTATFVPAANDFTVPGSPLTFVYTATVGTSSDTGTVTVNIAAVNDPPIFTADAARSTPRNTALTIPIATLLANDLPGPANETGTVTLAATPAPTATNGTVTVTGGNFVFTPTNNFTGAAVISYTISDGALTAVATLTVNITAPGAVVVVANNTTLAATEDTNATVNLTPLTTVTGSTVTPVFTITTQPARGTVTISGTTATLVPAANDFTVSGAPLTFVYIATVGTAFDTGTITVNIAAVNDAPIFTADPATSTPRNTAVTIPVAPLLVNDRPGPANETGTVTLAATPALTATNGTVIVTGGNFVFTPTNNFTGTAVISYTISDGALTSPATLTVNITAPATVVVANDSTLNFVEDGPAQTLALLPLTTVTNSTATPVFTIVTQPARGTLTLSGTSVTYLPAPDDFTTTSLTFVYRATVGSVSDTGTISVNISSVNDGPVVVADTVTAPRDIVTTFAPQVFLANDRPGPANEASQTLTVTAVSAISATVGTVALVNGQIVYTPEPGFMGTDRFQYTVSDGSLSATGVVTVNVVGGSTLTGMIFTDYLEGVENPVRDGVKDTDEPAMGGLTVRLTSAAADNVSGRPVEMVQLTDADGTYLFSNIVPGTYVVTFDVPDTVVPGRLVPTTGTTIVSSNSYRIVVGSGGDLALSGNNFTTFGTTGAGADNLDFLVSRYLRTNANNLNAGTAMFVFDSSGQQQFFQAGRGYEDAKYVEVALNDNRDAALLTVLNEDGSVRTSRLSKEEFTVGNDGRMIRLFGSANSIGTTVTEGGSLSSEFGQYRDTIDELIRTGAV